MPIPQRSLARPDGTAVHYAEAGDGPLVVLVMGAGSPGRVWHAHQVPALVGAGYRVVTPDNRGAGAAAGTVGFGFADLVEDVAWLVENLDAGPARVVGTSLGARITQELALARPDLVDRAVAMAAHARLDAVSLARTSGEVALFDDGVALPPEFAAAAAALQYLSPATRSGPSAQDWLDMLEMAPPIGRGERDQLVANRELGDRREAYRGIAVPLLALGFADDAAIAPYLAREVADLVPGGRYVEVPGAGHFGYLERPDAVNAVLLDFLGGS